MAALAVTEFPTLVGWLWFPVLCSRDVQRSRFLLCKPLVQIIGRACFGFIERGYGMLADMLGKTIARYTSKKYALRFTS